MKRRRGKRRSTPLDGPWSLELSSPLETERFGRTLGRVLQGGEVLALVGELGVGKTALVRGVASGLNVRPASVSSPTFVLIHQYHGRLPLIHVDLYRLRTESEAENIGLHEYFDGSAVTAIEWADRLPTFLPNDRLEVRMCHKSSTLRTVQIIAHGTQSLLLRQRTLRAWLALQRSMALRQPLSGRSRKAVTR
jgi:tRNA threonylcarbamoyladenosine biosynthesis protein TsaE